jgi:rSAM/selenodomain-associated transferase 1
MGRLAFRSEPFMKTSPPRRLHIMFAKRPDPGRVKTRLGREIGMEAAANFYRRALDLLIDRFASAEGFAFHLHVDPPDAIAWFEERYQIMRGRVRAQQPEPDLGDRMAASFAMAFAEGFERVALTCSDCPELETAHIREALDGLDAADASFGPATDGGYYLVAWKRLAPELFANMAWSRADVLARTRDRAQAAGLKLWLGRPLTDCDSAEDLEKLEPGLKRRLLGE